MRYFVKLSYNGTNYHGWQIQPNAITVQEVLNKAFSLHLKTNIELVGCGRTDSGVHARNYFAHFDIETENLETQKLIYKINKILPFDINIIDIFPTLIEMHARFSAKSRTYKYFIQTKKDPFNSEFSWQLSNNLNIELMNNACELLIQFEDFASFSKSNTDNFTTICDIKYAHWEKHNNLLIFEIKANRFLRNMVRAIVGTMIDIGKGKLSLQEFTYIIESKNRQNAGFSVPAKGLFLEEIEY